MVDVYTSNNNLFDPWRSRFTWFCEFIHIRCEFVLQNLMRKNHEQYENVRCLHETHNSMSLIRTCVVSPAFFKDLFTFCTSEIKLKIVVGALQSYPGAKFQQTHSESIQKNHTHIHTNTPCWVGSVVCDDRNLFFTQYRKDDGKTTMNQKVTHTSREAETEWSSERYCLVSEKILFLCFGFQNRL